MAGQHGLWYPIIFPDRCDGCAKLEKPRCVAFCPRGVFELRNGKAVVTSPQNCVYGCIACEPVCSRKAIAFPQRIAAAPKVVRKDKDLLSKVMCRICGKVFWTNREVEICMDCESSR